MYKVLTDFPDYRDGGYEYHAGDEFPRKGIEADEKRLKMLSEPTSMRGPLIAFVEEKKPKKRGTDAD